MTITEFCDRHNACKAGLTWAMTTGLTTMRELWEQSVEMRPEWREWIATRPGVLTDRELRLYSCWRVRQVWDLLTDERSKRAVETAERYANGLATDAELDAARAAAREAAWAAARAAREAAWAAWDATWAAVQATGKVQSKWLIENTKPNFEKGGGGE